MTQNPTTRGRIKLLLGFGVFVAFILLVLGYYLNASCLNITGITSCQRILFIGNSYTYVNDLPHTFTVLALSGGHKVETGMAAEGGWTLANHVASTATNHQLTSSKWNYVILQEQSEIPAMEQARSTSMYPAARQLVSQIKALGAEPLFFITWAHRDGLPDFLEPDYQSMQIEIDRGYLGISKELNVPAVPVGYAWLIAHGKYPELNLWQADGSHPSEQGTYLAACVFYAAIFQQSPEGLTYFGQLPAEVAKDLQTIAASTVLSDPKQWDLP